MTSFTVDEVTRKKLVFEGGDSVCVCRFSGQFELAEYDGDEIQ